MEEGKNMDVSGIFIMKHPFIVPKVIDYTAMDVCHPCISGAELYFPDASMVFYHFHVIRMMNDTLDKIKRKEAKRKLY